MPEMTDDEVVDAYLAAEEAREEAQQAEWRAIEKTPMPTSPLNPKLVLTAASITERVTSIVSKIKDPEDLDKEDIIKDLQN